MQTEERLDQPGLGWMVFANNFLFFFLFFFLTEWVRFTT